MEDHERIAYFYEHLFPIIKQNHSVFGWPDVQPADVKPTYMKALTNMTYKVQCLTADVKNILAKKFGTGFLDKLLNRPLDNKISEAFSKSGVGPNVLYYTNETRFEEFLLSSEFTFEDMNNQRMRNLLTYYIVNMHHTEIPDLPAGTLVKRFLNGDLKLLQLYEDALVEKAALFDAKEKAIVDEVSKIVSKEELQWIEEQLERVHAKQVVSHNDFLNGNILKLSNDSLKLIDFEYCSYNFPMYDLANFINESLVDYTPTMEPYFSFNPDKRDSDEHVSKMVKYYMLFESYLPHKLTEAEALKLVNNTELAEAELLKHHGGDISKVASHLDDLMQQLRIGYLLSHLYWIAWCLLSAKTSKVKFGYFAFAAARTEDYKRLKNKYFK